MEDNNFNEEAEEVTVVVERVNADKGMLNFMRDREYTGFFGYYNLLEETPEPGDLLRVVFEKSDGAWHKAISARPADDNEESDLIKAFEGVVKAPKGFGFVGDIFIHPYDMQKFNIYDEQTVSGIAIPNYNRKKEEWGWKAAKVF